MYCRNCGKEAENEICTNCGFKRDYGDKYCPQCGSEVLPGQAMCVHCGFVLENPEVVADAEPREENKDRYKKHIPSFKKGAVLALIVQILSILTVLAIVFLPIYTYKYEPSSLDEITSVEELEEYMENGYIKKSFSAFEDLLLVIGHFGKVTTGSLTFAVLLLSSVFLFVQIAFSAIMIEMVATKMFETIKNLRNLDEFALLRYSDICRAGSEAGKKENFLKKQTVFMIAWYAVIDILETWMIGQTLAVVRRMSLFSGFSLFGIIAIVLLVACFVVEKIKKAEEKKVALAIAREDLE